MAGVAVSINYDWKDGGANDSICEGRFGSVHQTPTKDNPLQPYPPKPKYLAALALQTGLGNFQHVAGRVVPSTITPATVRSADVFVLRFENASTSSSGTHSVQQVCHKDPS